MSYRCRRLLHRASTSAVLPEPTGPPTPTRSGPCFDLVIAVPLAIRTRRTTRRTEPRARLQLSCPLHAAMGMTKEEAPRGTLCSLEQTALGAEQPGELRLVTHRGDVG